MSNNRTLMMMWGATLVVVAAVALPLAWRSSGESRKGPEEEADATLQVRDADADRVWTEPIIPIPLSVKLDRRKVALGRRLFHDRRLSSDDTISCASCHSLDLGGADRKKVSSGVGGAKGDLNTPTVLNSGFNFRQFWDGRAASLSEQIDGPIHNPKEMNADWPTIVRKLKQDDAYERSFEEIYGADGGLNPENAKDAIVEFERSLITPNSRFDRFLRGDEAALTKKERSGYRVFKEAGCVTCHQGVNAGANMFQKLGRLTEYFSDGRAPSKNDLGRFNVTGKEEDRFKFKVPTLRNVALTKPYFHDGSVATLTDAVKIMAEYQLGVDLTPAEVEQVVAFLETLTGEYENSPK